MISYRDYKKFSNDQFRADFVDELIKGNIKISRLDICTGTALQILGKYAPMKQKTIRANESPFMNRSIKKEIVKRSRLKNKFLKENSEENRLAYNKQRNLCRSLLRKGKKAYFENLDTHTLVKDDDIVSENQAIAELFNKFFANNVTELNLAIDEDLLENVNHISDPVLRAIEKYKNHPSVKAISEKYNRNTFSFEHASLDEIKKRF